MNRFYEPLMNIFENGRKRSKWQSELKLELHLHLHLHLKVLLPLEVLVPLKLGLKRTPPVNPVPLTLHPQPPTSP